MGSRLFREQEIAGSTPAAPTGASSNGRAAVLQTADGGSIPSAPTDATAQFIPRSKVVSRPLKPVSWFDSSSGSRTVAVVYWSARLAVNEEVRVRSPPVTHNWVWVNGWPPGPEPGQRRFDSCRPDRDVVVASRALTNGRQPVPKTGVVVMSPRGSIPPLSSRARPVRLPARLPLFQGGEAGAAPARATACRVRLVRRGRCPLKAETRVRIPHATQIPPASGPRPGLRIQAQAFESPRGDHVGDVLEW